MSADKNIEQEGTEAMEDRDDALCDMCGGDGSVMLSECGPGEWGEDCFCEEDRLVACPQCKGEGTL